MRVATIVTSHENGGVNVPKVILLTDHDPRDIESLVCSEARDLAVELMKGYKSPSAVRTVESFRIQHGDVYGRTSHMFVNMFTGWKLGKVVSVEYTSTEGEWSVRDIEIANMYYRTDRKSWYAYAYCHNRDEMRTFKVNGMSKAIVSYAHDVEYIDFEEDESIELHPYNPVVVNNYISTPNGYEIEIFYNNITINI